MDRPVAWVPETRAAWGLFRDLARKTGTVHPGAAPPWDETRTATVSNQRPTHVGSPRATIQPWLEMALCFRPMEHCIAVSVTVRTGWLALTDVMRSWGVHTREDLSVWLRCQVFPGSAPGNHLCPCTSVEHNRNHRAYRAPVLFSESWAMMDELELEDWFAFRVPTLFLAPTS